MCNSGVGLTPTIDGTVHHFSAGGLFNGLVLLIDDETRTYWDHITGEAVHGPLKGRVLETWPLHHTTAAAARVAYPQARLHRIPPRTMIGRLMRAMHGRSLDKKGFIPPPFRLTMEKVDPRLHERTNGLGVVVEGRARFYPMSSLPVEEQWCGRPIQVALGALDGAPRAIWTDDGSLPMQLLSRWYGFVLTFPGCEIGGER